MFRLCISLLSVQLLTFTTACLLRKNIGKFSLVALVGLIENAHSFFASSWRF